MSLLTVAGEEVRSDFILSLTQRTDLAPIPCTLEGSIRWDADLAAALVEGAEVSAGFPVTRYQIVKTERRFSNEGQQDGRQLACIDFTAFLAGAVPITYRLGRAVIKEQATLAAIYTACGARLPVSSDFSADRFSCFVGQTPSFAIAQMMQEEGGAIYWNGKALTFGRLTDMMRQEPLVEVDANAAREVESEFQERHEIPWFYSIGDDGALIAGTHNDARASAYTARKSIRVLQNLGRCLVRRRELTSLYQTDFNAGSVIKVAGEPHAIITARHTIKTSSDGDSQNTYSKFWLGVLRQ